jgi:uncharacterized surface protein with fasciclin (FAS1) repeats
MLTTTVVLSRRALLTISLVTAMSGCATVSAPTNLAATIANTPSLSTLSNLVSVAGLTSTLQSNGPFTIFAPSNDAFKAVPAKTLDELVQNPEKLKSVLNYHVIAGKAMAADVKNSSVKTANGADVALSKAGDFVTIENAAVTQADIIATNGVIHIVDTVLTPPVKK